MTTTDNTTLVHQWIDTWHQEDLDHIDFRPLATDDFVRHDPNMGETHGPDGERQLVLMYRAAFPDLTFEVEHLVVEGDMVVAHLTARGTHRGELLGIQPTEREISVSVMDLFRAADGRISEQWTVMDALGMMQQLGAIPTPAGPATDS